MGQATTSNSIPLCSENWTCNSVSQTKGHFVFCQEDELQLDHFEEVRIATSDAFSEFEYEGEANFPATGFPARLSLIRKEIFCPNTKAKFNDYYQIGELLGNGSFGNVYLAKAKDDASVVVAAKSFSVSLSASQHAGEKEFALQVRRNRKATAARGSFKREIATLAGLDHPHIVRLYDCFEEPDFLWIVMEACLGGEVYEHVAERVRRNGGGFGMEESETRKLFHQMVLVTSYLHSCSIVHRDVKPENFLLFGPPGSPEADILKLCDFGTAVRLTNKRPRAMDQVGTLSYTAPEIYAKLGCSTQADLWSLGVVLYVLLVGGSPFRISGTEPREETLGRIAEGRYDQERDAWRRLSGTVRDLVGRYLVVEEGDRLNHQDALRHQWLVASQPSAELVGSVVSEYAQFAADAALVIETYVRLDPLQQLLLTLCVMLTPEIWLDSGRQSSELPWYSLFHILDRDKDGCLNMQEFVQGMTILLEGSNFMDATEANMQRIAANFDLNGNGVIDWSEWALIPFVLSMQVCPRVCPVSSILRLMDKPTGDDAVTLSDLLAITTCGDQPDAVARNVCGNLLCKWALAADETRRWTSFIGSNYGHRNKLSGKDPGQGFDPQAVLFAKHLQYVLFAALAEFDQRPLEAGIISSHGSSALLCCRPAQLPIACTSSYLSCNEHAVEHAVVRALRSDSKP